MATILVVEDDPHMAEGLAYNLARAGHRVLHEKDGASGLAQAQSAAPDLVLLDVMLPRLDGFEVLARLRASGSRVPVILLTALGDEPQRVRGFDEGADDYVVKPFSLAELLARVRRRLGDRAALAHAVAGGVVDLERLEFRRDGSAIALTPTECTLLRELLAHGDAPVARDHLLRAVWGADGTATRTLDTHVARLRRKLEADPAAPRHLLTVHGVGYRLVR